MSVPALRFKGFSDAWVETKIGEITAKVGSGSTPRGGAEVYQSTGIPFIRSQNVNNEKLLLNDITYISDEINNQMKGSSVKPNDILLNITGASIGRSCVVPSDFEVGNVNQHVCIIRLNSDCLPRFLQPYLSSSLGQKSISSTQVGSGREGLNFEAIRSFKVFIPTLAEQAEIANFLTAVDEKISQLTQKYDLLSQYKKGVMQKIFSQELRFKDDDGGYFPEWKEMQLSEASVINPKTQDLPSEFIYIDLESVEKGILLKETTVEKISAPSRAQRLLTKDDVLFQMVRPYQGNNLFFNKDGVYVASTGYAQIRAKENARFLYHLLHLESFSAEVMNRCTGTSYPAINSSDLAAIIIQMPAQKEQTKIANFLAAIDDKITATQTQLQAVKQYKQGLLQQMFV